MKDVHQKIPYQRSEIEMLLHLVFLVLTLTDIIRSAPHGNFENDVNLKLIILHNNDLHSRFEQTGSMSDTCKKSDEIRNKCFGGFARIAHVVKDYRRRAKIGESPNVLFLNGGDTFTGSSWFTAYKDFICSEFLNILMPDAMVKFFLNIFLMIF